MMRSLWTAASGMTAQQLNVDTIANNLSNVNTTGYKKERMEFKSLFYQTLERASLDEGASGLPVNLQVGLGVRPIVSTRIFTQGGLERTENTFDFAIQGDGFFVIQRGEDEVTYTRDGSFKLSNQDGEYRLVTSDGYPVLSVDGEGIAFPSNIAVASITIDQEGYFTYSQDGEIQELDAQLDIVQFPNAQGLEAIGENLFVTTPASGEPIQESSGDLDKISAIAQGVLEKANVEVAEEMVKLIVAQRAYELNSKSITTSDEMLQTANNLKR